MLDYPLILIVKTLVYPSGVAGKGKEEGEAGNEMEYESKWETFDLYNIYIVSVGQTPVSKQNSTT